TSRARLPSGYFGSEIGLQYVVGVLDLGPSAGRVAGACTGSTEVPDPASTVSATRQTQRDTFTAKPPVRTSGHSRKPRCGVCQPRQQGENRDGQAQPRSARKEGHPEHLLRIAGPLPRVAEPAAEPVSARAAAVP